MKKHNQLLAFTGGLIALVCVQAVAGDLFTLDEAMRIALEKNPELVAVRQQIKVSAAERKLASRLPNPIAEANAEELGSQADSKASFWLRQQLPLNGQRAQEMRVADLKSQLADQAVIVKSQEIVYLVKAAFAKVLQAQDMADNASQSLALAKEVERVAQARQDAQLATSADVLRAEAESEKCRIEAEQAVKEKARALFELANTLGVDVLGEVSLKAPRLASPMALESLLKRLDEAPALAEARLKTQIAEAEYQGAIASQMANPEIGIGYIRKLDQGENLIGTSIGWPLPLFGRNQEEIERAQALVGMASAQEKAARQVLALRLRQYYSEYQSHGRMVALHRNKLIPAAQEAFRQLTVSYRYGRLGYLDLLDAKRRLIDARSGLLQAKAQQTLSLYQIESLFAPQEIMR